MNAEKVTGAVIIKIEMQEEEAVSLRRILGIVIRSECEDNFGNNGIAIYNTAEHLCDLLEGIL